jgi:hypothetical protein
MKSTGAVCGPHDPILIPRGSEKTDWEVELGLVISRDARYLPSAASGACANPPDAQGQAFRRNVSQLPCITFSMSAAE